MMEIEFSLTWISSKIQNTGRGSSTIVSPISTRTITSTTGCSLEIVHPEFTLRKTHSKPNTVTSRVPSVIYSAYLFYVTTFSYGMVWVCNQLTIETEFDWHVHFVASDPVVAQPESVQTQPSTKLISYAILLTKWSTSFPYQVLSGKNALESSE